MSADIQPTTKKTTRTLLRGLRVLEELATAGEPLGVTEIALRTDLDKATVTRLVATLCEAGYAVQPFGDRRYQIASKILTLSGGFTLGSELRTLARPHLEALRTATDETIHLGCLEGDRLVYVDKLETTRSVRLVSAVGQTMPLHSTGVGKALLAGLTPEQRAELVPRLPLEARQPTTIRTQEALMIELDEIESRGFSIDNCENEENVVCVGAPVFSQGRVVAAISVSAPKFRMTDHIDAYGELCSETARAISRDADGREFSPRAFPA